MEFRKMIAEMKNYKINFVSGVIHEFILLFGLFGLLSWNEQLNFSEYLLFYFWYVTVSLVGEIVYNLEVEIRTGHLINLISAKTSLFTIYFKRCFLWLIHYSIYFLLTSLFFIRRLQFTVESASKILVFSLILILFMILIFSVFFSLTLIFERTSTFVAFFNSMLLIFGMRLPVVKDLYKYSVTGDMDFKIIVINFIIFLILAMGLNKFSKYKIHTEKI